MADSNTCFPSARRPSLRFVGRSVSDFSPLSDPSAFSHIDNEAGGKVPSMHAHVAGTKVVSGGRLATGGFAPYSPFLPLPPAPSVEELKLRQLDLNDLTPPVSDAGSTPRLSGGAFSARASEVQQHNTSVRDEESDSSISGSPSKKQKRLALFNSHLDEPTEDVSNAYGASFHTRLHRHSEGMSRASSRSACMMVRSYSLPVATQAEFDRQTKLKSWASTARIQDQGSVWIVGRSSPSSLTADSSIEDGSSSSMRRTFSQAAIAQDQEPTSALTFSTSSPKRKMQDLSALRTSTSVRPALAPLSMNTPRALGEAFQPSPPRNSDASDTVSEEKSHNNAQDQLNSPRWLPALSPPRKLEDGYTSDDTEESGACTPRAGSPTYLKPSYPVSQELEPSAKGGQQSASAWHDLIDFIHPDHL